jgi:ubiquinone/menaquinone biosynthesis C-methylase UbiE
VALIGLVFCLLGWFRKWSKWLLVPLGALTLWSAAAFLVVRFGLDMNGRMELPTPSFLAGGSGKVLDMGAGSGRSSLMVLEARPNATLVALDSFGEQYVLHFGTDGKRTDVMNVGQERLLANFRAAGVEGRASIQPGDMRQMPFEPATFDAVVSTYAIDHLGTRTGVGKAMSEASRVLKPGGQFLLMVLTKDFWFNFAFGPLFIHSRLPGAAIWEGFLRDAGFEVLERGTRPATLYFLSRKR